jgi:hypothetical protein
MPFTPSPARPGKRRPAAIRDPEDCRRPTIIILLQTLPQHAGLSSCVSYPSPLKEAIMGFWSDAKQRGNAKGGRDASQGKPHRTPHIGFSQDNRDVNRSYSKNYNNAKRQQRESK